MTSKPKRRGVKRAGAFMGTLLALFAAVSLAVAANWFALRREIGAAADAAQSALRQDAAAPGADPVPGQALHGEAFRLAMEGLKRDVLAEVDAAAFWLAAGVLCCILLAAVLCFRSVLAAARRIRASARLVDRLAAGDCSEDVPADQLARDDEFGELAGAIRDVTRYLREKTRIVGDMGAGDFTDSLAACDPADRLGLAVQKMARTAGGVLALAVEQAKRTMAVCEIIASRSGKQSADGDDAALALTEISGAAGQARSHAEENADRVGQASRLADAGRRFVEHGFEDIGEMGAVMLNMQACGDKIVRIANSIGGIAFQTNLLALNASVEAARAGRHGKGFTIVAHEVGRLAVRSSRAAEETSTLMKETVEQVELAAAIIGRINAAFADILSNIREIDALFAKIASVSREQSGGMDRIAATLPRMDRFARENGKYAGEIAERARALAAEIARLHECFAADSGKLDGIPGTTTRRT